MAGEAGRSCWSRQTVAVLFLLCTLAQSLTCFSLRRLSKKAEQDKVANEAAVMEVRRGSVLFNEGELDSESGSASAATTEISEQTSPLKEVRATEAAWRRLNPVLRCGKTKMTLKAMGPGAAHLQLDMGNARPRPLSQVPETCGYSMQQNARRLILVVPYDGCNVTQENGNYVLPMSWWETPVKLTCPMSPSPDETPASAKRPPYPWKFPLPHRPWTLFRHKRQATQPLYTYNPYLYYYYMYMMNQVFTTAPTTTTTAKPDTTTITAKPTTAKPPPAYPYYMYYPYYYHFYPYYTLPNPPASTTVPPASTTVPPASTTVPPATTTGPGSSGMTTTADMTTKSPKKPFSLFYPPYYPFYLNHNLPGQQLPENLDNPEIYYYPIIQHFYGKPPYPGNPTTPHPPTLTTKAGDTAKPGDTSPTTKPTTASEPTTASGPTTTSAPTKTTPSSGNAYPGPLSPYVSYYDEPFKPYVSFNKAGKLPDYQKYMPQDGYKSGLQARAYPHSGSNYWQLNPWFPLAAGQAVPQLDWKNLQPKQA